MKKRLFWVACILALAGVCLAYWRYRVASSTPEVQYKTVAVERRTITGRVTASGTLSSLVTVLVGTQVSGRIQHLYADFNSKVTKGQIVARIDPQIFQASADQAQANFLASKAGVAVAQANAMNAERTYARAKALRDQGLASQADLETAEAAVAVTRASVDAASASMAQARAALNQAQVNLSYTKIASPIDGVVISRSVDVGQTVAASLSAPTLFTIAQDLTKMQVDTNVAEGDVGRLQVDMPTYFTVDSFPGQRFTGKIREIRNAAQTVQSVVTYDAVIDVNNLDLRLRPGMTANVTIVYAERQDVLSVSNAALRFRPPASLASLVGSGVPTAPSGSAPRARKGMPKDGDSAAGPSAARTLWVLRGGRPQAVAIHTGLSDGSVSEVLDADALKEGDQVVVDATGATDASPSSVGTGGSNPLRRTF
jgi:HlyD family secretion protein